LVKIPGGTFAMGAEGETSASPQQRVTVAPFEIDMTEVTVAAYKACVDAKVCEAAEEDKDGAQDVCTWWNQKKNPDRPINCVRTSDAETFCRWAGKRLPTEEEWEFAARDPDGRVYPWGNEDPGDKPCWSGGPKFKSTNRGRYTPCQVGSQREDRSPFGALDMAGNLREWTSSVSGLYTIRRGGEYDEADADSVSALRRNKEVGRWGYQDTGFRCAK
jgi:formylglycine-generating enzyme required for sulfatase activity